MNFLLNKKSPQNALKSPSIIYVWVHILGINHIHTQQTHPLDSSFQIQKIGCQVFKNSLLHTSVEEKNGLQTVVKTD